MVSLVEIAENCGSSSGLSLARRLQEDATGAWLELVELYGPLVESWSAAAGLSAIAREDVAQEVFLAVHRSIAKFDPGITGATFRGWLWRITRNAVLKSLGQSADARGGSTAHAAFAQVADPWPDTSEFEPPSNPSDTTLLVHRAIEQIRPRVDPQTWQAFWSTAILGESTTDVAEQLGMKPAAVRKAKSRTLHRLRQQLGDLP